MKSASKFIYYIYKVNKIKFHNLEPLIYKQVGNGKYELHITKFTYVIRNYKHTLETYRNYFKRKIM